MLNPSVNRLQPHLALIASRALAALRPSLLAFLIAKGAELSGGVATPISFCNVLLIGNVCAAAFIGFWFGFGSILKALKATRAKVLFGLFINGCLATLLAALIFTGLQYTSVTNAVLIGRLGPVIYALIGTVLLGKRIGRAEWIGFSLITIGVIAIVLLTNNFQINRGDLLIFGSAFVFASTSLLGKLMLSGACDVEVVVFSRNFIAAVIFFIIAMHIFGPRHFSDIFSGQLWIIMAIYALLIVVFSQFLWYSSLGKLDSNTVGKLTVVSPIFGVMYAFIFNGEIPSNTQLYAFVVIITGVFIAAFGKLETRKTTPEMISESENATSASS